jgi:AbrB family looped-hinge helix DNA binding protein
MTVIMTTKNQVTIPKKIVDALDLDKGAMFDVKVVGNKIELIPLEVVERVFSDEEYKKLDALVQKQKEKAKKVTSKFIDSIK